MLWSAVTPQSIKSQDLDCGRRFIPRGVILGSNPSGAATQTAGVLALRTPRSRIYLPGVGLEIGNANVAEGDAAGGLAGLGEDVDVGDCETVGVGEGVGVGGGGIILSQRCSWTAAPPISSVNF